MKNLMRARSFSYCDCSSFLSHDLRAERKPPKIEFLDKILDGQPCRGSHLRSMFWIYSLVMLSLRKLRAKQASQSFSQDSLQVSTRKPNSNIMWSSSAATLSHLEMETGIIIISSILAHCTQILAWLNCFRFWHCCVWTVLITELDNALCLEVYFQFIHNTSKIINWSLKVHKSENIPRVDGFDDKCHNLLYCRLGACGYINKSKCYDIVK